MNQPVAATQPRRRRRFLFGLRSFMVFIAIVAVSMAWVAYERAESRRQLQIVEQLRDGESIGVGYAGPFDVEGVDPERQFWWRRLLGDMLGRRVVSLHLADTSIYDISLVAGLTDLRDFRLYRTPVSDISALAGLTELQIVFLNGTWVKDVYPLAHSKSLWFIDIRDTSVQDVSPLAEIPNLEVLVLKRDQVNDEQIRRLTRALPNCKIVN